jgi:hypothetical protein
MQIACQLTFVQGRVSCLIACLYLLPTYTHTFTWLCQIYISGYAILGFHYSIMQWIWQGVNLKCIDACAALEWENDTKFHVLPPNTRLIHKTNNRLTLITVFCFRVDPRHFCDVIWNPRIFFDNAQNFFLII